MTTKHEYRCEECGQEATHCLIAQTTTLTFSLNFGGDPEYCVNSCEPDGEIKGYYCEACLPEENKPQVKIVTECPQCHSDDIQHEENGSIWCHHCSERGEGVVA